MKRVVDSEHKMKVTLKADKGIFRGLARQNMLFHQCIGELVDNAIAAKQPDPPDTKVPFHVFIIFVRPDKTIKDTCDVYVADQGRGMNIEVLQRALQLGQSATEDHRLNEHGFGLKNALATLSGDNGPWTLWTRSTGSHDEVISVSGPFNEVMEIKEQDAFPKEEFLPADISTLIKVSVRMSFVRTVQGRGTPAINLAVLREWLLEHLGVMYRGYLEQDRKTGDIAGVITVAIGNDRQNVPPVPVPLGRSETKYLKNVELGGKLYRFQYVFGTLDEVKRDTLIWGNRAKYYYQGNQPTQGIDIRLGKRVIATKQLETIWKTEDGKGHLQRHNNYNDFVGELLIDDLPRGVLTTINNKTDFNLDDPDWTQIFDLLNKEEYRPPKTIRERAEGDVRDAWIRMLKATNPQDNVSNEMAVWPPAAKIDVYRKMKGGDIIIYELKVTAGAPIHLYQLKMYWDGLVINKEQPKEAILLVEQFSLALQEMANRMNSLRPPDGSLPYNFRIERLKDKGL